MQQVPTFANRPLGEVAKSSAVNSGTQTCMGALLAGVCLCVRESSVLPPYIINPWLPQHIDLVQF
jgi:hypothetical protein